MQAMKEIHTERFLRNSRLKGTLLRDCGKELRDELLSVANVVII